MDTNAQFELHVEILNYYMFFFEAKNDQVSVFIFFLDFFYGKIQNSHFNKKKFEVKI